MDKSMIKGTLVGAAVVTALGAVGVTANKALNRPVFAEVISAREVNETVRKPHEECRDVVVQHQAPVSDEHRIAGTVVGAVAGGLLGSAVGHGTGRKLATVAGAAAGGYAGNQVQQNLQQRDVVARTERRCKTVFETSVNHLGYDVTYRLSGKEDVVRLAYNPGNQIPVKDGKLVLDAPPGPPRN